MNLFSNNTDFDFVAIGDITSDAFIRIKDAKVICDSSGKKCELSLRFGDKVPYEFVKEVKAVGNSANAAVSASRLGLKSALLSNIGDDHNGAECIATLKTNAVDTRFISVEKDKKTNYHYVLWFEEERTILIKHEDYSYNLPDLGKPKWLYLSSLSENSLEYHKQIINFLKNNTDTRLAFQPGTFQMKMGTEMLKELYSLSDIFFCNVEEAKRILGRDDENDIKNLLRGMREIGPGVVVITDGPKGAYGFDGHDGYFMPPYPDIKPPYERTGAGDAFASTFTSAIVLGRSLFDAFLWAPINSMSVVQHVGAQEGLLTQEQILSFIAKAPQDYRPQKIM